MNAPRTGDTGPDTSPVVARPWRGAGPPARVLAIRLHALGDTVLTLPYLHALRRLLPGATLDFLTRSEVAAIPKCLDLFDGVFEIGGDRDPRRQWLSALTLLPRLRSRRYDVVLDLQRNRLSRVLRMALNPPAWSEFDRFSPRLAGERTRATIEAIGLGPLDVYPDLVPRDPALGADLLVSAGIDAGRDLVVLNPAGAFPGRSWPPAYFARFAKLWLTVVPAAHFVVLGTRAIEAKARYLEDRLGDRLLNLAGRTSADQAFGVLRRASLVISEDSGLMHMSWAAGTPTLGLFGASRSVWARPHGNYSDCVRACRRPDGACLDGACLEGPPSCLERVRPRVVLDRGLRLVQRAAGQEKRIPR